MSDGIKGIKVDKYGTITDFVMEKSSDCASAGEMSAKFTKGPWEHGVRKDGSVWFSIGDPYSGPHYQFDLPTTEANARLMAASPLLYEALSGLEWSQSNHRCCPACGRAMGTGHADDCKLDIALRAARGEG